jgi:hypothetical protein
VATSGSLSQILGVTGLAGGGAVSVAGTLAQTLGAITLTSSGVVGMVVSEGALDQTLGGLTIVSTGQVTLTGDLAATCAGVQIVSDGQVSIGGQLAQELGAAWLESLGYVRQTYKTTLTAYICLSGELTANVVLIGSLSIDAGIKTVELAVDVRRKEILSVEVGKLEMEVYIG